MGKKIFISYKYEDYNVAPLLSVGVTRSRNYVDRLEEVLKGLEHVCKCEHDGEDLSNLSDEAIWEKLRDRIYDSSVTLVLVSPNMKDPSKRERDQWIPWEVSYSLKETTRQDNTSHTNALVAIVLPDKNGSCDYYLENKNCCLTGCRLHHTDILFPILRKNKFNFSKPDKKSCVRGDTIWHGNCSYIEAVCWQNFISNPNLYIDKACDRQEHMDEYEICKEVEG
ncbi:MAG: TIR domain-containing protein [Elusimicrobiaceae bacterium]|nr:TIR domain-containing protein [Elusimicrobiaceae bacterium]